MATADKPPRLTAAQRVARGGEEEALAALEQAGYRIVARNYRCPFGELDLVAEEGQVLCFIEVKARSSLTYGTPRDAITPAKRRKLARSASHFMMSRLEADRPFRVDVVEVAYVRGRIAGLRLIRGAFSIEGELERLDG